jgi:hypothetical protein
MTTAPTDMLLSHAIEAEARKVMAQRAKLKTKPGTHGRQADLLVDVDYLLDRWLEVMADDH